MTTPRETIDKHIRAGRSNAEVLTQVKLAHLRAKVSLPTINLYRNDLRKKTKGKVPTDREAKRRGV
jgi:hypothetical protein